MTLDHFRKEMLPVIEAELQAVVRLSGGEGLGELVQMLSYHLGWLGKGAGPQATGKRVRPMLVLLSSAAAGGDWSQALPAAAAVELLHNFSLIHDDIQDKSKHRRGRLTLWAKWGIPQAINAGDAMFALAHLALERLMETNRDEVYRQSARLLPRTSLQLTQGQYLDLAYEDAAELELAAYWPMVKGKTAVLLSVCARLGALVGGSTNAALDAYAQFGESLGLAFQAHDDLLGIWGQEEQTGKSPRSDLLSGKKSLPVLYALSRKGEFSKRWKNGKVDAGELVELARLLEREGAKAYTEDQAARLTAEALAALEDAQPDAQAGAALQELANELVQRDR